MKIDHCSHLTAIHRTSLPAPVKWLLKNDLINGKVLDFGCGRCKDINPIQWDSYDPFYNPCDSIINKRKYETILCTYVLCVLPRQDRLAVLKRIQRLLNTRLVTGSSCAFISVRNDKPKQGWGLSKRNTYQGRASTLPLEIIHSNSNFRIYLLTPRIYLDSLFP